ncbi:hypothetical protein F0562_014474 [Nyssa sinensis]|uniref:3-beta hydroxysteroid dehydrogenase/isomerase domain-containing protein n=1 Tax=Nyssa sinensis TaxID=561372 RepID=A0A5J4ZR78_9ASTE|nr:hypothetical protein F0562_014474 [Nyssa sinensis]
MKDDPEKTAHLLALDGAKERLHLFKANLIEEGSFDPVVDGCEGVFHTASPVFFSVTDPQAELIDPAVNGTLNVLRSCAKVPSIKRVVVTSSMAAVTFNGKPLNPDVLIDETWFSDSAFCSQTFSDGIHRLVDVRDVVNAHIQAFEIPSASGRYCLVGTVTYSSEALSFAQILPCS